MPIKLKKIINSKLTLSGTIKLYHYSKNDLGSKIKLDPKVSFKNKGYHSMNDYRASSVPRVWYYVNPKDAEATIKSRYLYKISVDGSNIFNLESSLQIFNNDINNFKINYPDIYNIIKKSYNEYGHLNLDKLLKYISKKFNGIYYETGGIPMVVMFTAENATLV